MPTGYIRTGQLIFLYHVRAFIVWTDARTYKGETLHSSLLLIYYSLTGLLEIILRYRPFAYLKT